MNSISTVHNEKMVESKSQFLLALKRFIIIPIKAGLYGFSLVFFVIVVIKLLSFVIGTNEVFNLDVLDVMLSSLGFFFMFLIYILKNFH